MVQRRQHAAATGVVLAALDADHALPDGRHAEVGVEHLGNAIAQAQALEAGAQGYLLKDSAGKEVAEAVLFAAKDGRFLENPFLAITPLPPFSSFPSAPAASRALTGGEPGTLVSTGDAGAVHRRLHEALSGKNAAVTSLSKEVIVWPSARSIGPKDQACQAQWENTYDKLFENVGFKAPFRHTTEHLQWSVASVPSRCRRL